ncbi:MAG: transposase [Mesoflavibacter sp.]|nr:transposase [Mesoflavibacter sp.]
MVDSQSVKTVYASECRGFDGGKKVKGRKRHIATDTLGNLLFVKVHAANIHDTKAGCDVFDNVSLKYPSIEAFSGDAGYRGTSENFVINCIVPTGWVDSISSAELYLADNYPHLFMERKNAN